MKRDKLESFTFVHMQRNFPAVGIKGSAESSSFIGKI